MKQFILIGSIAGAVAGAAAALAFPRQEISKTVHTLTSPVNVPPTLVDSRPATVPVRAEAKSIMNPVEDPETAARRYRASSIDYAKSGALVKDSYWNINNIVLDTVQLDALNSLLAEQKRLVDAARNQWMGMSGPFLQKSMESGRYTTAVAKPFTGGVNMLSGDTANAAAHQAAHFGGPGFQLAFFVTLPPEAFPSLAATKRNFENQRLIMHDAIKAFFISLK